MGFTLSEQLTEAAKRSQRVLLALPRNPSIDEVGASVGLHALLTSLNKPVDIVSDQFLARPEHRLLGDTHPIQPSIGPLQHFVISVPIKDIKLQNLAYTIAGDDLRITLTPEANNWHPDHVRAEQGRFRHDLAITIGARDLASLGSVYTNALEFWNGVPIMNIDHHPANEHFGAVNMVDITASSVSELVYELLFGAHASTIQGNVATALLAGLIGKTRNFKTTSVSPKTLTIAAELVRRGAERERIVHELYRVRSVETLRLWGRALMRLRMDTEHKIAWSLLARQDFLSAGAEEDELPGVLDELVTNCPDVRASFLLFEHNDGTVRGVFHAENTQTLLPLLQEWEPTGSGNRLYLSIPEKRLIDAERIVLERLKGVGSR